jgi:zinc transport system permease protein
MMGGAILIGMLVTLTGMGFSYLIDAPSGATIILVAATVYGVAIVAHHLRMRNTGSNGW